MTEGVSNEVLKRYVEVREKIDGHIEAISVFTSLLSCYKACANDGPQVDLYALGYVNEILNSKALEVIDQLDAFLPLWDAKAAVTEAADKSLSTG